MLEAIMPQDSKKVAMGSRFWGSPYCEPMMRVLRSWLMTAVPDALTTATRPHGAPPRGAMEGKKTNRPSATVVIAVRQGGRAMDLLLFLWGHGLRRCSAHKPRR